MSDEYAEFMQSVNFTADRWEIYISLYIDINQKKGTHFSVPLFLHNTLNLLNNDSEVKEL